jgi:hypothetical protein
MPARPLLGATPILILVAVILLGILFVGRRRRPRPCLVLLPLAVSRCCYPR